MLNSYNYIYQANSGETDETTNLPIYNIVQEDAELYGFELEFDAKLIDNIHFETVYEQVRGSLTNTGATLPLLPADNIMAKISWKADNVRKILKPRAYLEIKHTEAKQAAGTYEPFAQFDTIPFGTASTGSYSLVNLGVGFNMTSELSIDLQANNLLDEAYRDFLNTYKGYTMNAGRNIRLLVNYKLK